MTQPSQSVLQHKDKQLKMPISTWQPSKSPMQRLKTSNLVAPLHLVTEVPLNQEGMMQQSRTWPCHKTNLNLKVRLDLDNPRSE